MELFLSEVDIPQYYKDITGTTCSYCGSPIISNDNLTSVKCINSHCPRKIAGSMYKIITQAGVKNIGIKSCLGFVDRVGYNTITEFLLNPVYEVEDEVKAAIRGVHTLTEAVQFLNIPGLKENISNLTNNFSNMSQLFECINNHPNYIWGVFSDTFGTSAMYDNMLTLFVSHISEMYDIDTIFPNLSHNSISDNVCSIKICISEGIKSSIVYNKYGVNPTKEEFVKFLNTAFSKHGFTFSQKNTVTKDVDFVVHDGLGTTQKAKQGLSRGILITSDNLIRLILRNIKKEGTTNEFG